MSACYLVAVLSLLFFFVVAAVAATAVLVAAAVAAVFVIIVLAFITVVAVFVAANAVFITVVALIFSIDIAAICVFETDAVVDSVTTVDLHLVVAGVGNSPIGVFPLIPATSKHIMEVDSPFGFVTFAWSMTGCIHVKNVMSSNEK